MDMKLIILLFLLHQFHAVASVILKGTPISTHPFGSKVKLTCVKEDGALVWTTSTGEILFNEETRYSKDEKYENFEVDISGNQSSMIITNALFEDEGEYSCSDANGKETILVKLEVAPRLIISYGGRQDPGPHIPSSSSPSISITCLAEGAKPEVSIRFKVGESDWLLPTINEITPREVLFDTNATLNYQFIDDPNGNVVTCETSGQSSINPIAETQTLMTPHCNLKMNNTEATCNCTSNPPVYKYILSIDGIIEVGNTINVENFEGSNISCYGVNYIGVGTYSSIVLESTTDSSFPFYVIIIALIILGAVIAIVVVYRWRKKHKSQAIKPFQPLGETPKDSKDTEHSESALPEQNHLLSEDRKPMENSNVVSPDEEKLLAKKHNHGRFKPTDTENRNAQRDNQHGAAGTPTASENKTLKQENNETGSSDKSGSSPSEHNHGRLKSTDTENLNAQRDNQHGAAGTPTASENKTSKHENKEKGSSEHNHGRFKSTDTENVNAQRHNQHGAASTATDSENKKQPHAGFAVTGTINQSHASPEQSAVQSAQRGSKEASNRAKNKEENKKDENKDELKETFRDSNEKGRKEESNEGNNRAKNKGEKKNIETKDELKGQKDKESCEIPQKGHVENARSMFESPQRNQIADFTQQGGRK